MPAAMKKIKKPVAMKKVTKSVPRQAVAKAMKKIGLKSRAMKVIIKRSHHKAKPKAKGKARAPLKSKAKVRAKVKSKVTARTIAAVPKDIPKGMRAFIVNLDRRPDRWQRVSTLLKKETPWLKFEQFKASDGTVNPIPSSDIADIWNTECNAHYGDYFMWVHEAPGTEKHGTMWRWSAETPEEDDKEWRFKEDAKEEFSYIRDAPGVKGAPVRMATAKNISTKETFRLKLKLKKTGDKQRMSGGERGCAHSHLRLWKVAAGRTEHTLVLEDDVHLTFDRTNGNGKCNGKVFTKRLALSMKHLPHDFDVMYLGWSGWRGGHHYQWKKPYYENAEAQKYVRKAEYVWTTVAYVISQTGAKKLLAAAVPMNQPVDNFMAWEASQGRLNSYVALDAGDDDNTWSAGIVDQFDFQGDSDIKKSDGGVQGDDANEFTV